MSFVGATAVSKACSVMVAAATAWLEPVQSLTMRTSTRVSQCTLRGPASVSLPDTSANRPSRSPSGAPSRSKITSTPGAAGSATSLALALKLGGGFFNAMKRSIGAGEWIRRALGAAVLVAVAAIALGFDAGLLTRLSTAGTSSLEQGLLDKIHASSPGKSASAATAAASGVLPVEGTLPALAGAVEWINSPPLTPEALRGKAVIVDFWTYSCINCLRSIPYVRAWAEKYKDQGLVVIGVHAPEFAFEKDTANVRKAVKDLQIGYPVAIDNDYAIWRAFNNNHWPAHYFIDAQGRIRHRLAGGWWATGRCCPSEPT